jgi:hypothetical protein
VFNDQGAFAESVAAALGRASAPGLGAGHVELLALLAGAGRASTDEGTFLRVLGVLDQNAGDPHAAELLAVLRPDGEAEPAGEQEPPARETGERRRRRRDGIDRTPARRRSRLGGLFDSTSTLFWPVVLVVFGLICLGCAGWFVQWVFETSPVGDQSLDQWYKTSKRPSPY